MASIPCLKTESRCFPCAGDSSNPFANLSIEPFDLNIWLSVYFGRPRNVTPNSWTSDACVGFCESSISQTDADDCATRRAQDCLLPEPPYDDPPPPEPPISPQLFCNQEVSCQSGFNCYTLPACTVFAASQAEANAIANSLCETRVNNPELSSPCGGGGGGGGGNGGGESGQTVTYEKAWNTDTPEGNPRGGWFEGNPCPWPDDYASTWVGGNPDSPGICLCNGDNSDPYQWPFGEGSPNDSDSIVTQLDNNLDAALDSRVLPNDANQENVSTLERLYLRSRIEGGSSGRHITMQAHWSKPGGAWIERYFNGDTFQFDDLPAESRVKISFKYDPCLVFQGFNFPGMEFQVDTVSALAESGDITFEFNVPANAIYYACIWFESKTHTNGPSMLQLVTTITDL